MEQLKSNGVTPIIVGFIGEIGSGKDTAADLLTKAFREKYKTDIVFSFAFADVLKNIIHETFGLDTETADIIKRNSSVKPFNGKTLRDVYQSLGENIKSYFGQNVWVDITMKRLKEEQNSLGASLITCTDVRYSYEAAALKKFAEDNGFEVKLIKMVNLNRTQRSDNKALDDLHISEQLKNIEYDDEIRASSVAEIDKKLKEIFKGLK